MKEHKMKDGTIIAIADMSDAHLSSTIKMLERRSMEGIRGHILVNSELANGNEYQECIITGEEALKRMGYEHYVNEQSRRNKEDL